MIVKVCDALCGAGKTRSCINMMNNQKDKRFLFVTPYLDEVDRIKEECSSRNFISPDYKITTGLSKTEDVLSLIRAGHNIAITHALFSRFTDVIKDIVRAQNYTLVLDEVIDLFQAVDYTKGELEFFERNNIVRIEDDNVIWVDEQYDGELFKDIVRMSRSKDLKSYDGKFYFWSIPADLFKSFNDVYVLTYMFDHQILKHFFDAHNIQYELIGTKIENGIYQFCQMKEMDRRRDLKSKIHILTDERYNRIGEKPFSLSSGWFKRSIEEPGQPNLVILKNNLYNTFRHYKCNNGDKMWTTFEKHYNALKGKGYSNGFLVFNLRASNEYRDKHYLAYCLNLYMFPWMRNYLIRIGADNVNQDMYALSVLIQWIFRSAIRDGEEIWLYIPSKRMRFLLTRWLENIANGDDLREITFCNKNNTGVKETARKVCRQQK